jgi:hypothetical protein
LAKLRRAAERKRCSGVSVGWPTASVRRTGIGGTRS